MNTSEAVSAVERLPARGPEPVAGAEFATTLTSTAQGHSGGENALRDVLMGPSRLPVSARTTVVQAVGTTLDDVLIHVATVLRDRLGLTVGLRRGQT